MAHALGAAGDAQGGAPRVLDTLTGSVATAWSVGYLVGFAAPAVLVMRRRDLR